MPASSPCSDGAPRTRDEGVRAAAAHPRHGRRHRAAREVGVDLGATAHDDRLHLVTDGDRVDDLHVIRIADADQVDAEAVTRGHHARLHERHAGLGRDRRDAVVRVAARGGRRGRGRSHRAEQGGQHHEYRCDPLLDVQG